MTTIGALQIEKPEKGVAVLTRVFDAPRQLVFDAITQGKSLDRWLPPPPHWRMRVRTVEPRVGGRFDCMLEGPFLKHSMLGFEHQNLVASYREILPPERLVFDRSDGVALVTVVLTEDDNRTTMVTTVRMISDLYHGFFLGESTHRAVAAAFDRLAALLAAHYSA